MYAQKKAENLEIFHTESAYRPKLGIDKIDKIAAGALTTLYPSHTVRWIFSVKSSHYNAHQPHML